MKSQTDIPVDIIQQSLQKASNNISQIILGKQRQIKLAMTCLLANGHLLIEDLPGVGKTTLALAVPKTFGLNFQRIQFTSDLLPADVLGVSIYDTSSHQFNFHSGPIFTQTLLADEINRATPKTQSALLEAMEEHQVTQDGETRTLPEPFFVIATQNPTEQAGTYPLPTPQLDRFLFKIKMDYIDRNSELEVLNLHLELATQEAPKLTPVKRSELLACRRAIQESVSVAMPIRRALVEIAQQIRSDPRVLQGVSTRSLVVALPALQAHAAIRGRDYVNAEDLRMLGPYIFCHRIERAPGSPEAETIFREAARQPFEQLVQDLLDPNAVASHWGTPPPSIPTPPQSGF